MPLSRRYSPEHAPGEQCLYGMDFSFVIPVGVGIESGTLDVWHNTVPYSNAEGDFLIGAVSILGRVLYAQVAGGVEGNDYQFRWVAYDTDGNTWPRTALQLCAQTS